MSGLRISAPLMSWIGLNTMRCWKKTRIRSISSGGDGMVNIGSDAAELMVGSMGIKTVAVGAEIIYTRPGGYIYIELETKEDPHG